MLIRKEFSLDEQVFKFKNNEIDYFTLRHALQGIFVTGSIGSGKSSGSGAHIARAYLKKGFGGIVLTGKVGEREEWERYAAEMGRSSDMIYFDESSIYRFNPLSYEMRRSDKGGKRTETMRDMFLDLAKLGNRLRGGASGSGDDPYWELSLGRLTKSALDIIKLSGEDMSIINIAKLIRNVISGSGHLQNFDLYMIEKELIELGEEVEKADFFEQWDESYLIGCLYKIEKKHLSVDDQLVYNAAKNYFLNDFALMPEKQKSSVMEMFWSYGDSFLSGLLAKFFGSELSDEIMPEQTFAGKVIVLDFPVHTYGSLGLFAQALYLKTWMDAVQRRSVNNYTIPVFLWIDECQFFLDSKTMLFQTTARSSRAASVFITQNISNLYAMIGNKDRVNSLLGNLVTKIFHANNDYVTNEWASRTIAKAKKSKSKGDIDRIEKADISEVREDQVHPIEFTELSNGASNNIVEAIVTSVSRSWSSGTNYLRVKFRQPDKK